MDGFLQLKYGFAFWKYKMCDVQEPQVTVMQKRPPNISSSTSNRGCLLATNLLFLHGARVFT